MPTRAKNNYFCLFWRKFAKKFTPKANLRTIKNGLNTSFFIFQSLLLIVTVCTKPRTHLDHHEHELHLADLLLFTFMRFPFCISYESKVKIKLFIKVKLCLRCFFSLSN